MPSTNKLGLSALLLAGFALGYVLGKFSQPNPAESTQAQALEAGAETDLATLRSENASMREQLSALRGARDFDDAPPERADAPSAPPSERARRYGGRSVSVGDLPPQHKLTFTRQRYGQLLHELSLSEAEADAVLAVLSAHERPGPPGRRQLREPTPEDRERDRVEKEELTKVLGPERTAELERLRASMPLRNELSNTRTQLERIGEPMTDEQQKQLMQKLNERELAPYPERDESASPEERADRFQAWRRDRAQAVRQSAEGVLTPKQIQRLEESDALSDAMRPRPGGGAAGSAATPR